jgi:hypothetical protein
MSAPDPTELLARIAPISDADAADVFGAGKEHLLDAITQLSPGRSRRVPRRPLAIALAVLAVAAATGAGWAVLSPGPARETTGVACVIHGHLATVIDALSGDPAADCATIWPAPVPKLQAYDDGTGGIAVIPASEPAPAGWTPIESQDVALIVLQERLDDHINGLESTCFTSAQATTFAQQQLDGLGLAGWSVDTRSGDGQCYGGLADAEAKTVTLLPMGDPSGPANWPPQQLADSLRPLTQQCLSLDAMKSEVVQRATALGMTPTFESDHNYVIRAVEDNALRCATVTESVTGTAYVIVRGPASP